MLYNFVQPAPDLRPYVEAMLQIEHQGGEFSIRNFPASNISLAFNYRDDLLEKSADRTGPSSRMTLEGFQSQPVQYTPQGRMGMVIIVLKPWARSFMKELGGSFSIRGNVPLGDVYGNRAGDLLEQIAEKKDARGKFESAQNFLREVIIPDSMHLRVTGALELISRTGGLMPVPELGKEVGLSKRQFDRVFQAHIGTSPKHYARVIRLRNSLRLIRDSSLSLTDVAHEAGFYDQSHFIKDFKKFTGFTPLGFQDFKGTVGNTCHQIEKSHEDSAAPASRIA